MKVKWNLYKVSQVLGFFIIIWSISSWLYPLLIIWGIVLRRICEKPCPPNFIFNLFKVKYQLNKKIMFIAYQLLFSMTIMRYQNFFQVSLADEIFKPHYSDCIIWHINCFWNFIIRCFSPKQIKFTISLQFCKFKKIWVIIQRSCLIKKNNIFKLITRKLKIVKIVITYFQDATLQFFWRFHLPLKKFSSLLKALFYLYLDV